MRYALILEYLGYENGVDFNAFESHFVWLSQLTKPTDSELLLAESPAKRLELKFKLKIIVDTKIAAIFGKEPRSLDLVFTEVNAAGRASELQEIVINGGTLDINEQIEKSAIQSSFTRLKAIRSYAKQMKLALDSADPDTFDISLGWPE